MPNPQTSDQPYEKIFRENLSPERTGWVMDFPLRHLRLRRWLSIAVILFLGLLALGALVTGVFRSWMMVDIHGRAVILRTLPLPMLFFVVSLIAWISVFITTKNHWQDGITLYDHALERRKGKNIQLLTWDSMERFDAETIHVKFGSGIIDRKIRILLEDDQGNRMTLKNTYQNMEDLIRLTREKLIPKLHTKSVHRLNQGAWLVFHPNLAVVQAGLEINGQVHPWRTLSPIVIRHNKLQINNQADQKKLIEIKLNKVKNLDILRLLLENPPF